MRSVNLSGAAVVVSALLLVAGTSVAKERTVGQPGAAQHLIAKKGTKAPAPAKPVEEPARQADEGNFTYALKDIVKAKSSTFCARYGSPEDCIQDIEICMTMLDRDEDTVQVCMTMSPTDEHRPRTASARR